MVEYYAEQSTERYDLSTDISQRQDLAQQHQDRVAAMSAELDGWRRENFVFTVLPDQPASGRPAQ